MIPILIAILCGFVGGLLGAMIIVESRETDKTKEIESLIKGHLAMRDDLAKEKERIGLVDHAVRVLNDQISRDKGAILGNLNDVWNNIDRLSSQDTRRGSKTAEIRTKAEKTEKNSKKQKESKDGQS